MKTIHVNLKEIYPDCLENDVILDGILYDKNWELNYDRDAVLILPGGGYEFLSYRENEPIMFSFLSFGFNAFTLNYSLKSPYPIPHIEVACAMNYINEHSEELNINKYKISIVGFSAGGHLAATYGYIYEELADNKEELDAIKPYSLILAYPVTTMKKGCKSSVYYITNNDKTKLEKMEVINNITTNYPPTFMFSTKTDEIVNVSHSLLLREELKKHRVKHKCIIYPSGPHGFALANEATSNKKELINDTVSLWPKLAVKFIKSL